MLYKSERIYYDPNIWKGTKMALVHLIGEIVHGDSLFSGEAVVAKWGLLIIAVIIPTMLFFLFKHRRKAKEMSILIRHNRDRNNIQKNSGKWEKGKRRIEKLLYEMTDHMQPAEFLNPRSGLTNNNGRHYYDIPVYGRTNKTLRERNMKINRPDESGTPLDVQELKAVSTLAKQLQARSHHSVKI